MELLANTTFWVGVAFAGFIFLVLYFKAHKTVGTMLDERAATIEAQIEEAKNLRAEAENLLIEYQRKQRDTEREAADMIAQAKEDAQIMANQAKDDLDALMRRRERGAAEKIAQAEANAVKEVKAAAVNIAVDAATAVLADAMKGKGGKALVDEAIADVEGKLH
ncbi:MAG: hypothetical protein JJ850_03430 [Kordiimonadaceae bacterium]|nr:hypothetical protein [Kordiimonadaceae bacterium]MBO6567143.1 hypothetical protein [Kordiimonadaceae bacterium]MBO6963642.1 hypothetical protein [Kordiimonadaceae bacterium]